MNKLMIVSGQCVLWIVILSCRNAQTQLHLYYTDQTRYDDLYYDCLYYKLPNYQNGNTPVEQIFKNWYQILRYCVRPFSPREKIYNEVVAETISSRFTFEQLRKQNVSPGDLFSWSSSIDLIEHYDEYLTLPSNDSLKFEMFYNCSSLWFGTFCQYTFNTSLSFNIIVNGTFGDKIFRIVTNMTCYIDLKCDRGPAPACLDWREICDGKVDCLGNGIDEIDCFELEMNECEENEFRCHNGMCIPEEFIGDGFRSPDCLDSTDEDNHIIVLHLNKYAYFNCPKDPGFWCEETDYAKRSRSFVCGDGQRSNLVFLYMPTDFVQLKCSNSRDDIMKESLLSYVGHSDLSYDCWRFLYCTTIHQKGLHCRGICDESAERDCCVNIKEKCHMDFIIFPQRPVLDGHVLFVYSTNKTILFIDEETIVFPDYVCYDVKRCSFLPTISLLNINGTTCRSTKELNLYQTIDIIHLFQGCVTSIRNEHQIDRDNSSLFRCPGTTKYISKHRVLDGIYDCYNGTDEQNVDACHWNDKYRFKCSSENKCLSPILVRNSVKDCLGGEDELSSILEPLTFQKICNGYIHLDPLLIEGFNETDETHCEDWPCNNLYTRCDGAWNCPNGSDELDCISTKCPPDTHECVSPITKKVICLPVQLAGDGFVDCLGSTDERSSCRLLNPKKGSIRYKCWNETSCLDHRSICFDNHCRYEKRNRCLSDDVKLVFDRLEDDKKLEFPYYEYFILERSDPKTFPNESNSLIKPPINVILPTKFGTRRTGTCNRGILIYVGSQLTIHCLCPPSYFGDRCQFQHERVSLTLQFSHMCLSECFGIFDILITLIDQDNIIHSAEHLIYMTTYQCENKYYIYLLYQSRPKNRTKKYNIHIDAYNKVNLIYHASWIIPVQFLFLPVNRISAYLIIPVHSVNSSSDCSIFCGHGQCFTYANSQDEYFCRCHSGWFGVGCTLSHHCDCSLDSKCLGIVNQRSICLCPLQKFGPRCRLQSICQETTCQNGGICIPDDERVSNKTFLCLCPVKFSGVYCEIPESKIYISFDNLDIPRSLLVHFITALSKADPTRMTLSTKIPYDRDMAIIHISVSFHLMIVQITNEYYLVHNKRNNTPLVENKIVMRPSQRCPHAQELFNNKTRATYPLLRRVKYYHQFCRARSELKCFHDNEEFMCLCNEEQHANCFPYDFNTTYTCKGFEDCQNGAQCFSDRPNCPYSRFCVCQDCFYGSKCQFSTKGFGLSLDAILGYQIRPRLNINHQPMIVKISITLSVIMFATGLINSILSIMAFQKSKPVESGCRQYLLATSIISLCTTILFSIKFWMLLLSQMSLITNMIFLRISCISIDFSLRLGPAIVDWINASVAIDRALTVTMGISFNKKKSKQAFRWVITGIILGTIGSLLHDPINRQFIYDDEEERTWCLVQYSSSLGMYNWVIDIIHFFGPFVINLLMAFVIIIVAARKSATARRNITYRQHISKQFRQHKHLIISSIILVLLAAPRLIISFVSGCMKSARNSSLFIAAYFISLIPPSLTFIVFVVPSELYTKDFYATARRFRRVALRRLNLV